MTGPNWFRLLRWLVTAVAALTRGGGAGLLALPAAAQAAAAQPCDIYAAVGTPCVGATARCQSGAVDQHWTHNSDDSLETLGRCLDIDGNGTAAGTKVELYTCNGTAAQQFKLS